MSEQELLLCKLEYERKKEIIQLLVRRYEKMGEGQEKEKLGQQINDLRMKVGYYEMYEKMHSDYRIYGDNENKADIILRGTGVIDNVPVFQNMNDEEMMEMVTKMSVGVFEEEEESPEVRAFYQNQNIEGLTIYKQKLCEHYEYIYKKYGLHIPDVEFVCAHCEEILNDFAGIQIDKTLTELPYLFKEENPEDRLMKKMIIFYHKMTFALNGQLRGYAQGYMEPEIYLDVVQNSWSSELKPLAEELDNEISQRNIRI